MRKKDRKRLENFKRFEEDYKQGRTADSLTLSGNWFEIPDCACGERAYYAWQFDGIHPRPSDCPGCEYVRGVADGRAGAAAAAAKDAHESGIDTGGKGGRPPSVLRPILKKVLEDRGSVPDEHALANALHGFDRVDLPAIELQVFERARRLDGRRKRRLVLLGEQDSELRSWAWRTVVDAARKVKLLDAAKVPRSRRLAKK